MAFVVQSISTGRWPAEPAETICLMDVTPKPFDDQRAASRSVVPIRTLLLRVSHYDQWFPLFGAAEAEQEVHRLAGLR